MEAMTMMTFFATNWTISPSNSSNFTTTNPAILNFTTFDFTATNFTTSGNTTSNITTTKPRPPQPQPSKCEIVRMICALMNQPQPPPPQPTNKTNISSSENIPTTPHLTTTTFTRSITTTVNFNTSFNSTNFTTPSPPRQRPPLPFPPEKACFLHKVHCAPRPHVDRLCISMGAVGLLAFCLNIFVIIRILTNNLIRAHQSKIYFFSMAFADLYFGACCFLFTLIFYKVIPRPNNQADDKLFESWWVASHSLSLYSSLFHVVVITADRFMATTFPLFHKVHVNRKKVIAAVSCTWLLALILALIPEWSGSATFPVWFSCIVGIAACVLLIVTYARISHVAIKRRKTLKTMHRTKQNNPQENAAKKSINTTFLSITITAAFILCNLFGILHAFCYLFAREVIESTEYLRELSFIENLLLNVNAAVNPMLYSIVELMNRRTRRSTSTVSYNTSTTTVRRRKTTVTLPQSGGLEDSNSNHNTSGGVAKVNVGVSNGGYANDKISPVGSVHNGMLQSSGVILGVLQEDKESSPVKNNESFKGVANDAYDFSHETTTSSELVREDV